MKTLTLFLLAASLAFAQQPKNLQVDENGNLTRDLNQIDVTTTNTTNFTVGGVAFSTYLATLLDTSAELRALFGDESGDGAILFANGNIGAATATTPAENDNDTSVATTAYVQTEIAGISGLIGGMGALWPTADIATPPTGYFEAGLYGTTAQTALGSWSIIVKSLGTLATPTVSPAAGEIADGSTITFSSTDSGVTFRHTTSGTDPTYTTGTTGATTTLSGATTYEFIATKPGYPPSAVQSVAYTIPPTGTGLLTDLVEYFPMTGTGSVTGLHAGKTLTLNGTIGSATAPAGLEGARNQASASTNSNYLDAGDDTAFEAGSSPFSISVWVKAAGGQSGVFPGIVAKYGGSGSREFNLGTNGTTYGTSLEVSADGASGTFSSSATINTSTWSLLGVVWDGTNLKMSLNGASFGSSVAFAGPVFTGSTGFWVFRRFGAVCFAGDIGPVAFWKGRALTAADFATIYDGGNGLPYASW